MLPFDDSRRLIGPNPYFAAPGAALESVGIAVDTAMLERWRANIVRMRAVLGWPADEPVVARPHASGASLAFAAPPNRLLCATEVNEWAWGAACERDVGHAPGHPATWDIELAQHTLAALAADEAIPALKAWLDAAARHRVPVLLGEDLLSLGSGEGGIDIPLSELAAAPQPDWDRLRSVPTAVVTGSNGKTTTVRLIAAMQRAIGRRVGYSCTDGLFVEGHSLDSGDYSGPIGARTVLRRRDIDAAVLETARGGLLRRGLALQQADVAVVTNISADHFGEYGVHSIADLARVKLTVAQVVRDRGSDPRPTPGLLVLNADDAQLRAAAADVAVPVGWFSLEAADPFLHQHASHSPACVQRDGALWLHPGGVAAAGIHLGDVADMPLTLQGVARYNIANLAGAALAGFALGVPAQVIAAVLADFGNANHDNRGRLERWNIGGVQVLLDYAHNPEGLAGLLDVAGALRGDGRLGLILGHAGNRLDDDFRALAQVAARHRPDRVVLKDIAGYERGRSSGEIAAMMRQTLQADGLAPDAIHFIADETAATAHLLDWAESGDILVLPIHGFAAKDAIIPMLDALAAGR